MSAKTYTKQDAVIMANVVDWQRQHKASIGHRHERVAYTPKARQIAYQNGLPLVPVAEALEHYPVRALS